MLNRVLSLYFKTHSLLRVASISTSHFIRNDEVSRDVTTHKIEECESRVLMIKQ
jgi:hypothetical protein